MKNIIVVSDDKRFGRELVFNISKKPDIKATLYTPSQYSSNEFQLTGNNYVIFFEIDDVSEDFVKLITPKYSEDDVFWGYEGTKAFIYTKKNKFFGDLPFSIPVCINLLRRLIKLDKELIYQLNDIKELENGDKIIEMVMDKELNIITHDFVKDYKWNINQVPLIGKNEIYKLSHVIPFSIIKKKYAVHSFLKNGFDDFVK